jgi:hypothetical protein
LINHNENHITGIKKELEEARDHSIFEKRIRKIILDTKKEIDTNQVSAGKESASKKQE